MSLGVCTFLSCIDHIQIYQYQRTKPIRMNDLSNVNIFLHECGAGFRRFLYSLQAESIALRGDVGHLNREDFLDWKSIFRPLLLVYLLHMADFWISYSSWCASGSVWVFLDPDCQSVGALIPNDWSYWFYVRFWIDIL